jgi:hypothetical protein
MITVRYHIASLCAMILMLGIGISIGLILGQNIEQHQAELTKQYYQKLRDLKQAEQDESQLLNQNRQALTAVEPHLTSEMLAGKRIAIIRTGDYPEAAQDATDALALTGAIVTSSITISNEMDDVTDKQRANILGPLETLPPWSNDPGDNSGLYHTIVQALKIGTTNHQNIQDAVDRMSSSGYISYSGDFGQPVDLVIVVGGSSVQSSDPDYADEQTREKAVLDQLISEDGYSADRVVGCEPRLAVSSSIPLFQQEAIGSVDCIDEPIGALDIVYALHGESGVYGVKPGAHLLFPSSIATGGQ